MMLNGKIWKWATALLVLCNVALLLTIWLKPAPYPGRQPETPRDIVIYSLRFTDQQVTDYDVLIGRHRKAMDSLRHAAMPYRQQLFGSLGGEPQNPQLTDSLAAAIAATQREIELVTLRHFQQVRALCTPAQKPLFDHIIGEVIKKMNNGRPGGHPPGDGRGATGDGRPQDGPPPGEDGPLPPPEDR